MPTLPLTLLGADISGIPLPDEAATPDEEEPSVPEEPLAPEVPLPDMLPSLAPDDPPALPRRCLCFFLDGDCDVAPVSEELEAFVILVPLDPEDPALSSVDVPCANASPVPSVETNNAIKSFFMRNLQCVFM